MNNITRKITYQIIKRTNTYKNGNTEWAFNIQIDGGGWWTIYTWNKKPSDKTVKMVTTLLSRILEISDQSLPKYFYQHDIAELK